MRRRSKRKAESGAERTAVGPYRIVDVLGRGGMGVVYAAEDERLGRRVALKTLGAVQSDDARARLWREARAAAGLNHPGICQVYDVVEEKGDLWVAMELLEGEGLDERLERERLGVAEAVEIGLDILEPLGFLHEHGLVHRDLKPSNIFLTAHGTKLLDFGLARPFDGPQDTRLTQTGAILGTPHYMAPEQWRAQEVGPHSDLFSCGAILYEMLAGRHAFPGADVIDVFHAVAHEQPPPLTGAPGIATIDAVVRRAIAKDPHERLASAAEMAKALEEAMDRVRALEPTSPRGTRPGERPAETIQRFIALPFRMLRPDPEIDFLATSLPEAIGASLAGLQHLVVRSTRLAEGHDDGEPDLKQLASEVEVDYALAGNLMRAGSRVRLSAELLQVPAGTVVWSLQEDVELGDLFQLQDDLASKVVEGVAIPLSPAEEEQLHVDVPASPEAYERYLRALHAIPDTQRMGDALRIRDLLRSSVEEDPGYAPAWAQYGRVCRLIAKYHMADPEEHLRLADEAFKRAFECNPDSPLVHNLYTYYQLEELADSRGAMLRLLDRVRERTADAELWAGLVPACRFLGLYQASIAAHERARGLDPKIQTSVDHTYVQLGEYERALEVLDSPPAILRAAVMAWQGDEEGAIALLHASSDEDVEGLEFFREAHLAAVEGRGEDADRLLRDIYERGVRDPDMLFFFARVLSRAGVIELALDIVEAMVDRGWYSTEALERDSWLEPLRSEARFQAALERAHEGRRQAAIAFREAGGEKLLGVKEV